VKKTVGLLIAVAISLFPTPAIAGDAESVTAQTATTCEVRSWEITWGFKESFRAYLSGTIARGGWETAGNITYATPVFTLAGSNGLLAADGSSGEITGFGRIDFTGHEGFLDQTVSAPKLVIESGDRAALYLAVSGDTQEGVSVSERSVRFAEINIHRYAVDAGAGLWSVVGAPVTLTEDGSAAFGTYSAGESLDPMDIAIRVTQNCLERDNLVALWLVGGGAVVALGAVSFLVWRRLEGSK
jgi:hypothetical protein